MGTDSHLNIGFILGDWSRNIGNAFFQLAGQYVISKLLPSAKITILNEQPGYPSYWNRLGGNPKFYLDLASLIELDYLVLMGPMFRPETRKIWGRSLEKILSSGTQLILLGVAAMEYSKENIRSYRNFLKQFPPLIFTSRDKDSYELLGDLAKYAHNGIDLAFFLPELYSPTGLENYKPYIVLNFDKTPEPKIRVTSSNDIVFGMKQQINRMFEFKGYKWELEFPKVRTILASRSRYLMFLEGLLFSGHKEKTIGKYDIFRTDHRPHPMIPRKAYRYPNTLVNDTPYPYLEVYGHAVLTLSNRIHACVAALAYGNAAMLFSSSPRIRMLERLGLNEITREPCYLCLETLRGEKMALIEFLNNSLSNN